MSLVVLCDSQWNSVEVIAFAPGVDPKKLQLTVDKGLLVIAGERGSDETKSDEKSTFYAQERFTGSFRRVISLPDDADPEDLEDLGWYATQEIPTLLRG